MAVDELVTRFVMEGADRLRSTLNGLSSDFDAYERRSRTIGDFGTKVFAGGTAGALGLAAGLKSVLDATGEIQQVSAGFETMLGSPDAAIQKIKDVQDFARNSPFDFTESARASQRLLAMGFSGKEIIPTLNAVGNAVAAAGGNTETFTGVLTALGQIKTKGKLSNEELMQIGERGLSVRFLKDELGLTAAQMGKIGDQGISADRAIAGLLKGFAAVGGGTGMAKQMQTLPGMASSTTDSFKQMQAAIGEAFAQDATKLIGSVTTLLDKTTQLAKDHPELFKTLALLTGGTAGAAVVGGGGLMAFGAVSRGAKELIDVKNALLGTKDAANAAHTAKTLLKGAVDAEAASEVAKTGIANVEATALKGTAAAAEGAAAKMGVLGRAKSLLGGPAGAAALGVGAGLGLNSDMQALGYKQGESLIAGASLGMATGAAAMFIPGAAVPIAVAEGMRFMFNKLYNEPMETAAGTGAITDEDKAKAARVSGKRGVARAGGLMDVAREKDAEAQQGDSFMEFALRGFGGSGGDTRRALAAGEAALAHKQALRAMAQERAYNRPVNGGLSQHQQDQMNADVARLQAAHPVRTALIERKGRRTVLHFAPVELHGGEEDDANDAMRNDLADVTS